MTKQRQEKQLVYAYMAILGLLFVLVVTTPVLVRDGISIFTEEHIEMALLATLTLAGFFIYRNYRTRLIVLHERYDDLTKHVGALNLQTVQIESMFNEVVQLPKSKRDLKRTLVQLNVNILSAVQVPWVLTRVVDSESGKTLTEQLTERVHDGDAPSIPNEVSNKALLTKHAIPGHLVLYAHAKNTDIATFCVLPKAELNHHQNVLIRTAMNSIAMLYLMFRSEILDAESGAQ